MNWRALDLNLLRVLDAMLTDANTTRAAACIGLSQPAVSAGLGRLRATLDDPLFVRQGNRLVPTRYAEHLRVPLRESLASMELALAGSSAFRPDQSTMTFRIVGDDFLWDILLPGLCEVLAKEAPGIGIEALPLGPQSIAARLIGGEADIVIDRGDRAAPEWVDSVLAMHARPVVIAAKRNRALRRAGCTPGEAIPLDLFCTLRQAGFSPGGDFVALEDAALAAIGRRRHLAVTLPNFLSIARLVARSQLIGMVPAPLAFAHQGPLDIQIFDYPFPFAPVPLHLFWHVRDTPSAAHRWMREKILGLSKPFDAPTGPARTPRPRRASGGKKKRQ